MPRRPPNNSALRRRLRLRHRTVHLPWCARAEGTLHAEFFLDLLRRGISATDARQQLDTAIDWGRYAELFDYDTDSDRIAQTTAG
ncbi:AAA-associated domain-containing protein [Amycolatopsis sp. cg13]|uniref:AAA-associated domain-containing protein n=1 Tax=Amycolatopsis sp. cg13 TaxID=3238807 RepID=UPI0035248FB5